MQLHTRFVLSLVFIVSLIFFFLTANNNSHSRTSDGTKINIQSFPHGENFCVVYNLVKAKKSFREDGLEPISFATHSTPNYLKMVLDEQLNNWEGPISFAMFIDPSTYHTVEFAYNLHRCRQEVAEKLSIHLVSRNAAFDKECGSISMEEQSCSMFSDSYIADYFKQIPFPFVVYPINVMRNVARLGAPSKISMLADVEVVFSQNFPVLLKKKANEVISEKTKTRLIVRRFEAEENEKHLPRNHRELKEKIDKSVFEFHVRTYPQGHKIDGLKQWFDVSDENLEPIVTTVQYKGPQWEPQVMLHSSDPLSNEDTPIRFQDQQVLVYELCRANFTFLLPSHVFNVHRGVTKPGQKAHPLKAAVSWHQHRLHGPSRAAYFRRVNETYPSTFESCGKFHV